MGLILDSTPAMAGWGVEVRRESFYLTDPEPEYTDSGARNPSLRFERTGSGFSVPAANVPHIMAAFDQVLRWHDQQGHPISDTPDTGAVQVIRVGDRVHLDGIDRGMWQHLYEEDLDRTGALEITYAELPELRRGLRRAQTS